MSTSRTSRRLAATVAVTLPLIATAGALAARPGADDDSADKRITLCHATSSASNPYVLITVAADAIVDSRTGRVEGHGTASGTHGRDIIPAFSFTWGGRDYAFPGKNLDDGGAAFLANHCRALPNDPADPTDPGGTTPAPTPTKGDGGGDPDADDMSPANESTIRQLDDVAPEGLGTVERPRTVNEADPDEAVLRAAIRPSARRPLVGQRVTFRVTGRSLGPDDARNGTLCAALPAGFSLADSGNGMVMGRVICWIRGIAPLGTTVRSFVAVPLRGSAGRLAIAPASNTAANAYRVDASTTVRPRQLARAIAVTG